MQNGAARPSPESLLAKLKAEEQARLRVYLGAAPGVGKTYQMLEDAHQLKCQGVDVVVAIVETHGRADTAALISDLEHVPLRTIEYRGVTLKEMDLEAVIQRRPAIAIVDELAHTNVPGSRHPKRWHDVEEMLEAGINVYTTLNVQHLESLNDVVARITGRGPDDIDTRLLSFHLIHQLINFRLAETVLDRRLPPQSHEERVETILKFIKPSLRNQLRAAALESGQ